jgi:tetratricopeptide (TPR) repeat protein
MTNCRKYSVIYTLKPLENNISQPTNKEMNTLEQLKEDLKLAKEESKIFNILIKLSNHNINRDITDCAKYQKQALSNPNIDLATTFRLMAIKTRNFISIGDQENFLTAFDDLTVFITDNKHLEEEYSEWCVLNLERLNSLGKYEEAVTFGKKALKEINNNVKSKWKVIKQMAGCCARISKISLALALYEQALNLTEKHKLGLHNADLLNDIAVLHAENDNLENAKKYFSSALDKYEELNDIEYMINTLSALASVHSSLNEFDEAIKYYNKTIEKIHEHKYYGNYVHTLTNFGYFRLKQKNYLAYFKIEKTILSVIKDKKMTSNTAYFFYTTNSKAYLEYGN